MARTTVTLVKEILTTGLTDASIQKYIVQANKMVTRLLGGEGLTDELLTDIETWLTAHLISITKERQPGEEKVGDIWIRHQGEFAAGLNSTTYGQMALQMDTSGVLQKATMKRARIRAIQQDSDATSEVENDQW